MNKSDLVQQRLQDLKIKQEKAALLAEIEELKQRKAKEEETLAEVRTRHDE